MRELVILVITVMAIYMVWNVLYLKITAANTSKPVSHLVGAICGGLALFLVGGSIGNAETGFAMFGEALYLAILVVWVQVQRRHRPDSWPARWFSPMPAKADQKLPPKVVTNKPAQASTPQQNEVALLRTTLENVQEDAAKEIRALQAELATVRANANYMNDSLAVRLAETTEREALYKQLLEQQQPTTPLQQLAEQLTTVCGALVADSALLDDEVHFLAKWIDTHAEVKRTLPGAAIAAKVADILADGVIAADERLDLLELLLEISAGEWRADGTRDAFPVKPSKPPVLAPTPSIKTTKPPAEPAAKAPSTKKPKAERVYLDEVEFDYVDSAGKCTTRNVMVQSVDGIYVKGICTTRKALRTFLIERIDGHVTSTKTGEYLPARQWALGLSA
ncbi:hypothetical protein SAMN02745857_01797 [Andreprevotia lacus DSM 23236]|jgi:hypothetical protein|uniref:Uncharacterized protein n=1 Tax=Andreprevotia lacus DSM 23236 TaxID=1121001 RepID=A0A1W1XKF9_9NEIS|nr:hypothetical protein [Andreprevotia lacus]SMC24264.1 hypothetical protein SAMN02745857_01797 [Andreprevotia lacus DSM 23236]